MSADQTATAPQFSASLGGGPSRTSQGSSSSRESTGRKPVPAETSQAEETSSPSATPLASPAFPSATDACEATGLLDRRTSSERCLDQRSLKLVSAPEPVIASPARASSPPLEPPQVPLVQEEEGREERDEDNDGAWVGEVARTVATYGMDETVDEATRHLLCARESIEAVESEFAQIMSGLVAYGRSGRLSSPPPLSTPRGPLGADQHIGDAKVIASPSSAAKVPEGFSLATPPAAEPRTQHFIIGTPVKLGFGAGVSSVGVAGGTHTGGIGGGADDGSGAGSAAIGVPCGGVNSGAGTAAIGVPCGGVNIDARAPQGGTFSTSTGNVRRSGSLGTARSSYPWPWPAPISE
eukprot:TRINITY_DN39729_c1_g1_i2.p1 TRINITY_DN39729_c1_g1~~TRINITY_DN39729_c1_g1_i2.p1  ORF type:complete len:352 (+),score=69.61 TRINITY_DN39729_c1_g1_i2:884-1939(+)